MHYGAKSIWTTILYELNFCHIAMETAPASSDRLAPPLFYERQYFRQIWLWIILLLVNGFFIFALVKQIFFGQVFGDKPMSNGQLIFAVSIVLIVTLLFVFLRLETEITEEGVYYRFFPFQITRKKISWSRISKAFVRQYNPIAEYGGWGLRIGLFGRGRAFNVSGKEGLQLIYDNGKKFLIGTNKPVDLQNALQQLGRLSTDARL